MFRSFHQRILVLVVGLVVFAQLGSLLAVLDTIDRDVKLELREQLSEGTELLTRLLDRRSRLLLGSAEVLAADYGFKSAIASGDAQTIRSALKNSVARIDADLASLVSLDGQLLSTTGASDAGDEPQYARLSAEADVSGMHVETLVLAGQARQVVVVPVKAPITIAWLLLGFALDDTLAAELSRQVGMHITFADESSTRRALFGSTLNRAQRRQLPHAMDQLVESDAGTLASLGGEVFLTYAVTLNQAHGSVSALLQSSLRTAMRAYLSLRARLIVLATVALGLAIALAVWMAHSVTRPVQALSSAAARIRDGHYDVQLQFERRDEFADLATTFNAMQTGIAEREAHIAHQAFHDELTGLPNLRLARDRLQQAIAQAARDGQPVAVMALGVDRFRQVTETLGHTVGDHLIQHLAERAAARIRAGDTVARVASAEFVIIARGADRIASEQLFESVARNMTRPVALEAAELVPAVSCGVALYPEHGEDATALMRRADIALTDAREHYSQLRLYASGRDENHRRQLTLVADLKRAVDEDQLVMHYQPKIGMQDLRVHSAEALVRWIHPEHGFMPPDEFITLAEKSGSIGLLSQWILGNVIAQVARWHAAGIHIAAAVNLSAMDLQDETLPGRINALLSQHRLAPCYLIIEVTESAMMRDAERAIRILHTLREQGFCVSIDDFGTGYSSLSKLRDLPIDELKIDRSFIIDIQPDTPESLIVKAIIDLGHSMGMKITTEGIESREEWDVLQALGSDTIQGYYISRPLPAADFGLWWLEHQGHGKMPDAA